MGSIPGPAAGGEEFMDYNPEKERFFFFFFFCLDDNHDSNKVCGYVKMGRMV